MNIESNIQPPATPPVGSGALLGGIMRRFKIHWHWIGWNAFALGVAFDWTGPFMEIHFSGGFLQIGWLWKKQPNCYSTTGGSLIQFVHFLKFKSSKMFIINKTKPGSTTGGSLIQFTLTPNPNLRKCFITNRTHLDQRLTVR
jgi:hypothetical protein